MSQFDRYTVTEYVEALRVFLKMKKAGFTREAGLTDTSAEGRKGRLPRYSEEAVQQLEEAVNARAQRAEAADTTLGERYQLARDYKGFSDSEVAKRMGVSRELTRLWGANINKPSNLAKLAEVLDVPVTWLELGKEDALPATSHIGVRVGFDARHNREQMYGMTTALLADVPDGADESQIQAFIENSVKNTPWLAKTARRAGGRWQVAGGALLFAPWVPIHEHGLTRRYWSNEVEAMIEEELASKPSVYGAWHALKARCEAMGLSDKEYPKLISLHKRVEKERIRADQYGVDLNEVVAEAVAQHQA